MTTIYLIRHAEAEGNLYRIAQGQHESALTDRGWRQVRALEKRFLSIPVDGVYTSPLYRARATASAVANPKGLPLIDVPELCEIRVGDWEGRTWGEIARLYPEQTGSFNREMDRWQVPGAERPRDVLERVRKAVLSIAEANDGKTVAVVSHGYAVRLLLGSLQGLSLKEIGNTPIGDNTAVSLLEGDGDHLQVLWRDDNRHLLTPEYLAQEPPGPRANALETGLWFRPYGPGEPLPAGLDALPVPEGGPEVLVLTGYLDETPVGVLALGPNLGRIALAYIAPDHRGRGLGTQLLGQAVQHTRRGGGNRLSALGEPGNRFLLRNGFRPGGEGPEGGPALWEKDIGFPEL